MDTIYELSDEEVFTDEDFLCPPTLKVSDGHAHTWEAGDGTSQSGTCMLMYQLLVFMC